jgi:cellobiose-specific phosphotransferase system component IIA
MQNNKVEVKEVPFSLVEAFGSANQTLVESLVAIQQRNLKYSQSVLESTIELLKGHVGSTRSLMEKQTSKQQETFQQLMPLPGGPRAFAGYVDLFSIPLAYFQQLLELLESVLGQSFGSLEQATESFGQVTQQALGQWQEVAQRIPPATQPSKE